MLMMRQKHSTSLLFWHQTVCNRIFRRFFRLVHRPVCLWKANEYQCIIHHYGSRCTLASNKSKSIYFWIFMCFWIRSFCELWQLFFGLKACNAFTIRQFLYNKSFWHLFDVFVRCQVARLRFNTVASDFDHRIQDIKQ